MDKYQMPISDTAIVFCSDDASQTFDQLSAKHTDQIRLKEAALYFTNVIPIGGSHGSWFTATKDVGLPRDYFYDLIPSVPRNVINTAFIDFEMGFHRQLAELRAKLCLYKKSWHDDTYIIDTEHLKNLISKKTLYASENLIAKRILNKFLEDPHYLFDNSFIYSLLFSENIELYHSQNIRSEINNFISKLGLSTYSPLLNIDSINYKPKVSEDIYSVNIVDLPMVNLIDVEWDNIMQMRDDINSSQKMRRLRLFMFENFNGKSRGYIEDKFAEAVDEYERSLNKHGFETKVNTLEQVINSKSLLGSICVAFGAAMYNEPLVATASLFSGAMLEASKIILSITKSKYKLKELTNQHPLAYIQDIKKYLKNKG